VINNVIVFGGSGMVGSNLKIQSKNSDLNFFFPTRKEVDLNHKGQILRYLEKFNNNSLIINLAGKVGGIKANMDNNYGFLLENTSINLNLIDCAYKSQKPFFLNISSSCIYPKDHSGLLAENHLLTSKLEPTNEGYALAKISALKACYYISSQSDFNYKTIIPCNLYGPYDKFDENAHMIPAVIKRIYEAKKNGKNEIEMWGDGSARREFMYVEDFVGFLIYASNSFDKLPLIMNLGLGEDYTISQYYESIIKVINYQGEIKKNLNQPIGMKKKQVNTSFQKQLGWKPKFSLENGIKKTFKYFLENEI